MKTKTKIILFSVAFLISLIMIFVNFLPAGELRSKTMMFPIWGILLFLIILVALVTNFLSYLVRKNKNIKLGIKIGAILAIPFFILLVFLEIGTYNNERGMCSPHPKDEQLRLGDRKPICDRFYEAGLKDGEEWNSPGITCVNGVYSNTNYRCITYNLGFRESEAAIVLFWWIILAEFYGILGGILIGWAVSKLKGNSVKKVPLN